ncbi:hypothetical protein ES332_D06G052100v1 [Gossypium tomentosum]|uniref:BZIP domain-containing protein n=1 Tax=Gossypium tomentosum TaxID=34277 RepID=A0A5D2KH35_GOSTO|nr:hypothetical protein ES332_D06G052100v1 [Gossypium tomentosum]TYH65384.1 hypothetical protein ES332_D06G052100v1 [Gossypium tomentosum]
MSSLSAELTRRMAMYEQFHQINKWGDTFNGEDSPKTGSSTVLQVDVRLENKAEYISSEKTEPSRSDQGTNKPTDKIQRRLAQNREAARKSRLRKKAYVQQLESSRLKLAQLEQELERARQQGLYISSASTGYFGLSAAANAGITAFEMEYGNWVEEQNKKICELRSALQAHITDIELHILVENSLNHYCNLFHIKADAAKADIFYLISGIWRTTAERFFHWIGGFRPSELLNGIDRLQQNLAESVATDLSSGNYRAQLAAAIDKLQALEGFVKQADHLRQQTLQQMARILTTRQTARGLLALGEYFHRLRALSSLWSARPREPA